MTQNSTINCQPQSKQGKIRSRRGGKFEKLKTPNFTITILAKCFVLFWQTRTFSVSRRQFLFGCNRYFTARTGPGLSRTHPPGHFLVWYGHFKWGAFPVGGLQKTTGMQQFLQVILRKSCTVSAPLKGAASKYSENIFKPRCVWPKFVHGHVIEIDKIYLKAPMRQQVRLLVIQEWPLMARLWYIHTLI